MATTTIHGRQGMETETMTGRLKAYHCLCSTHILTTPYEIDRLPRRAAPSMDQARILHLPNNRTAQGSRGGQLREQATTSTATQAATSSTPPAGRGVSNEGGTRSTVWRPSLLSPSLRPQRKPHIIRREDGYEKRRLWRCAHCSLGIGYEVVDDRDDDQLTESGDPQGRTLCLLEDALVDGETLLPGQR